jgi:hypothetical protein
MPDPDDCCKFCDTPPPNWWLTATHCAFVVDPDLKAAFHGTVYAQVREQGSNATTAVIDVDDAWVVDVHLEVGGQLVRLFCGYWCVSVCLESMCSDTHYRFPQDATEDRRGYCCCLIDIDQDKKVYDAQICVPANRVRESECGAPYELTVIVTTLKEELRDPNRDRCDPDNHRPLGIATACELPLMTFYKGI